MVAMTKAKTLKAAKGYSVRPATLDDLKPIVGIYNWAVNQTFATIDSEPLSGEEAQAWWEMHGKRSFLLVATDDTAVVGWARLLPWKQRAPRPGNFPPPPLTLSPTGTSTPSAARRIVSAFTEPSTFGSTSCNSVHPPTNPATAGMSIDPPE